MNEEEPGGFLPPNVPGLVAWYRADKGISFGLLTAVSAWADQSGSGDANRNLTQGTAVKQPTLNAADAAYGNKPTLSFASASLQVLASGAWSSSVSQPFTTIVIGNDDGSITSQGYLDTQTGAEAATLAAGTYQLYSGSFLDSAVAASTSPKVIAGTWSGGNASIYVSALTAKATGAVGTNPIPALTVGALETGIAPLNGKIAEVLIYSRVITAIEIAKIFTYAGTRYGMTIGS